VIKKALALLLILALSLSFAACTKYKPVESTDEEARRVLTLKLDGESYEIPYELYRTFFLQNKREIDGGDGSVWTGENSDKYAEKIEKIIFSHICEIYATFHLCKKLDIDLYSKVVEETIEDYVKASVEGGTIDGLKLAGFGGDYDAYLESLKKMNMNYSVQTLLFRYTIAVELLNDYYEASTDGGKHSYTKEDVKAFYEGKDCVRVIEAFLSTTTEMDKSVNTPERAERIRYGIAAQTGEYDVGTYIISQTLASESVRDGTVIGRYSLDEMYYGKLTEAAFSTELYGTSEVIEIITGSNNGYFILYRADKSDEHFEKCYHEIEAAYLQNIIGKDIADTKKALISSIVKDDFLKTLDLSAIGMG